jgi:hypothetical protein
LKTTHAGAKPLVDNVAFVPPPAPVAAGKILTADEMKAQTVRKPSSQSSTIGFLFFFFACLFLVSYLVHRAGGPGAIEVAVDRFVLRMTGRRLPGSRVDRNGMYNALPR